MGNLSDTPPGAAYCQDPSFNSDNQLTSPAAVVNSPTAQLVFRHNYSTESCCDGCTLEISINGGGFNNITSAGGSFAQGGYNSGSSWRGSSGGFITSRVNLPPSAVGQTVQFRWRLTSDFSVSGGGWYVDTISMSDADCCVATNLVDLTLSMTNTPNPGVVASPMTLTFQVTNRGPAGATGVVISNQLPAGATFVSGSAPGGCTTNGSTVFCSLGAITNSGFASASVVFIAPGAVGTITNNARVYGNEVDRDQGNNRASAVATLIFPSVSIFSTSVVEGNSGLTNALFQVTLSSPSPLPVSMNYSTSPNTATAGVDYIPTNGVLVFAPGETNKFIAVAVIGDTLNEANEFFYVFLSSLVNASFTSSSAIATIINDDPLPLLTINDVSLVEGNVGTTNAVFNVSLSPVSGQSVTVSYATANGTAVNGTDYFGISGTLTFLAGETNKTLTIPVVGNITVEPDKTFFVNLSNPFNAVFAKSQGLGTIINDDGFPGQIDHFVWGAVASPQYASEPFAATVTAKDAGNVTISNYAGPATVQGQVGGVSTTNSLLNNLAPLSSSSLTYSLGLSFIPNTNILVTHVRHISGTKVSIWTDTGVLLASQNVVSTPGTWLETPLATPVTLLAGVKYRVAAYTGGGVYYYQTRPPAFANGTIPEGVYSPGDAFPTSMDPGNVYLVDLRYTIGSGSVVPVSPASLTGLFTNGVWSGAMRVLAPATNVVLTVTDGDGHTGAANGIPVLLRNDLGITGLAAPFPADVRSNLTYSLTITNAGPNASTGVTLSNLLPAEVNFISASSSQGSCINAGRLVTCALGTLADGATATVTIVVKPVVDAIILSNVCQVGRSEPETYLTNNTALVTTPVRSLFGGGGRVAIFAADLPAYYNDVRTKVQSVGLFSQVDAFDARNITPTLSQLSQYDSVLIWGDYSFNDGVTFGNVLADYVDAGGGVLVAVFALDNSTGYAIQGRLRSGGYLPFVTATSSSGVSGLTLVKDDASHPIVQGINSFNGGSTGYHNAPSSIASGAALVAHWSNGQPLVGVRQTNSGRVAGLNFWPPSSDAISGNWLSSTDGGRLMANALAWASARGGIVPDDVAITSTGSPNTVSLGGTVTYTLTITNTGPSVATGVVVSNVPPAGANLISFSSPQATAANVGGVLVFNFGAVPTGTNMTATVVVQSQAAGVISNLATVTRTGPDSYTPNNRAVTLTTVLAPVLSILNPFVAVIEGNSGTTNAVLNLQLSAPSPQTVSVDYATADDTALAGSDYLATNGTVVFLPGVTNQSITVAVVGDTLSEPNEDFAVNLFNPTNATLASDQAFPTILDDDPVPQLSITDVSIVEGNTGTTDAVFTVTLSAPYGQTLYVNYDSFDGSAQAGSDYLSVSDTLVFAPLVTNLTISVPVVGDTLVESNETFYVEIFDPFTSAAIVGTGTIINNAVAPFVSGAGAFKIKLASPGVVQLQMDGLGNGTCVIEVSTDLINWRTLCTNVIVNGKMLATDSAATNQARFYRARIQP